ncbi:translation initiation factor if-2 [Streptomyces xiamenensis]|uniref:Translation initiation factor if-2 n=1 Tax=Streptomyces xiamenensis TaxID=408015 RepID=A0A0F7FZZ0_9ACTN|nr:translation initiation factor if-2 [Streptomyces xiamenensis]
MEFGHDDLAFDSKLLGELVYPDLSHFAPYGPGWVVPRTFAISRAYSSRTHRVLIAISTYFRLARYLDRVVTTTRRFLRLVRFLRFHPADQACQLSGVKRPLGPIGPGERPTADRQLDAGRYGVHIGAPTGQRTAWIRDTAPLDQHRTQQIIPGRALPTAHARPLRACLDMCPARHS